MNTFTNAFLETSAKYGDKVGLSWKEEGKPYQSITWGKVYELITDFTNGLKKLGFKKDSKIAILEKNSPQWLITDLSSQFLSGINVPIYNSTAPRQIEFLLNHSESSFIVIGDKYQYSKLQQVRKSLKKEIIAIVVNTMGIEDDSYYSFDDVLRLGKENRTVTLEELNKHVREDDIISFVYTSGTTGVQKGVMLSHKNFFCNINALKDLYPITKDDTILSFLPLSHVLERLASHFHEIYLGSHIVYAESIEKVSENLLEARPTVMISVPRLYEQILKKIKNTVKKSPAIKQKIFHITTRAAVKKVYCELEGRKVPFVTAQLAKIADRLVFKSIREKVGGRLNFFVSGGAPLSVETIEFFFAAGLIIYEGYGLTETSPVISANQPGAVKFGSVGKVIPNVEVKISDDGEILVKGDLVMKGYYKDEAETKEAFDEEGWFKTGDIGFIDKNGFITITDRKKNIIVMSNGKNVAPSPIESQVLKISYLSQAIVLGDNQKYLAALIVPDKEAITRTVSQRLEINKPYEEMLKDEKVIKMVKSDIDEELKDLAFFERIKRIALLPREWTEESGELTPTKKTKRKIIEANNRALIKKLF